MGFNCLTKLSVTSQTLWPPPAEDLCCLMLRRRHSVYVYIFIFYGTEQFLHMGAEPLGWIGTEFGIISIIHTGAALLLKKENGIKNTRILIK